VKKKNGINKMTKKLVVPVNMMIYKVALNFAAVMYETGRSQGMPSKYKTPEAYAKRYVEKYIPLAVKHLLTLLKPNSGITEHMRSEIYEALMDPVNDKRLTEAKVNPDLNLELLGDQLKFNKLKILTPIETKKSVIHR